MPAQRYSQYFNISDKYYAVVTKKLIDEGKVKWDAFYPHETFIQLLHQVVSMLSGKETQSIWVEGTYGTGKSHAALTLKCLLEAPEEAVRDYFKEYGLSDDLCSKFLAARSEEMNGKLIVVHRIGSSNIKNDDDLVWAVQDSVSRALRDAGVENMAAGTMKEAFLSWVNGRPANKEYLSSLISEVPQKFGGMGIDMILQILRSDDEKTIETLMEKLIILCRENGVLALNMDAEKLAAWLEDVIEKNGLGAIVFIWDEFSEFFENCQNSLTGFQTLTHVSFHQPFYFVIVTHESDGLIAKQDDRSKISDRFIKPRVHIELPDNMAFQLMAQAMKETDDQVMKDEWAQIKQGLNIRLGSVRARITAGARKHAKAGAKTILSDEDLQKMGYDICVLPVDRYGIVHADTLENSLNTDTLLVSIMLANNEIGTIQPIKDLAEKAHRNECLFHTDAVQAVGHIPIDVKMIDVDMLSASAHKFNGPKGVGFLFIREGVFVEPFLHGGAQEKGRRAGTENVAGIVGMAEALREHYENLSHETVYLKSLTDTLLSELRRLHLDFISNGSENRIPGSLSLSFRNVDGEMLLHRLDLMGTAVATGSACDSKKTVLSHVIQAIGVPEDYAKGTIRITLGLNNNEEQSILLARQITHILRA